MNYEILISVSLGDNLPLQEEFLSRACKTTAILEAKFNEELATELGFRLNKKDFQQFRIERKSIKLQCFVEYSTRPAAEERHFIGYVVLQIRDIQEYSPGRRSRSTGGTSTKRPQLYLAFMVNKLNEAASDDLMSSSMTSQTSLGGGNCGGLSLSESHHEYLESAFIRPLLRKEPAPAMSSSVHCFPTNSFSNSATHEFDSNLKVKLKSRTFYVWDENRCREADCTQMYLIQIQIDRPRNLANLLGEKKGKGEEEEDKSTEYHFKYTMLGKQIRSASFFDLATAADFRRHRFLFPILTFDGPMLQEYFEAYPTVEIRLCSVRNSVVIGFVTTNLLRLFENSSAAIEGDYMIVPEDESVYVKEPFPVVQLKLAISRMDHHQQPTQMPVNTPRTPVLSRRKEWEEEEKVNDQLQRSTPTPTEMPFPPPKTTKDSHHQQQKPPIAPLAQHQHQSPKPSLSPPLPAAAAAAATQQPVNHYYISIDLRTIRLTTAAEQNSTSTCQQTVLFQPFYLQFSYAFFGISDYIKTYPAIRFAAAQPLEAITVPHGFCGFNFATTREKLLYTFSTVPFIVTLHLEADDTLLGTAELDLSCLLKKKKKTEAQGTGSRNQLGEDQFVNTTVPVEDELNDQICEMQVVMFLQEMTNLSYCADEPNRVEVASRRRSIVPSMPDENEENVSEQLNLVNQSLNDMIIETAHDIELWKEEQMRIFKSRLKLKEQQLLWEQQTEGGAGGSAAEFGHGGSSARLRGEGRRPEDAAEGRRSGEGRLQERLYLLERRLKERELKIRELEASSKGPLPPRRALSAQRTSSLTRSAISSTGGGGTGNTGNTGTRRIVITRDTSTPPLSKSMIEPSSGKPVFETGTRIGSPASHHRSTSAKPPPPLKTTVKAANHRPISTGQTMIPDPPPPLLKSTTEAQPPPQPLIIEKIKKERQELLKRGVSLKDPLIVEIDKRIRNYRPVNVKRI
ncbi:hypothetical protein TYRP_023407 [Tyrophagus putrescentiae]|nr:hypothetical protein TYRP_023407 [Tyrophagus putrescentiae]